LAYIGRTLRPGRKNIPLSSQTSNTEIGECVAVHCEGTMGFSWGGRKRTVSVISRSHDNELV